MNLVAQLNLTLKQFAKNIKGEFSPLFYFILIKYFIIELYFNLENNFIGGKK